MKFLVLISVLPHAAASSFRPQSGAGGPIPARGARTTEGTTHSGAPSGLAKRPPNTDGYRQPRAKRPNLGVRGPHIALPEDQHDRAIYDEDMVASSKKPIVLLAAPGESGLGVDIVQPDSASSTAARTVRGRPRSKNVPSVIVTMQAKDNAFLARLLPLFAPSFADPVVDPSGTREIELEPRGTPVDETGGVGAFKTGWFYKVKGTDEEVVIKWYHESIEAIYPVELHQSMGPVDEHIALVLTDFYSQSIAHLLSKLYSEGVGDTRKVYYMQPLLVTSRMEDGTHYGLMERKFGSFFHDAPNKSVEAQFLEFMMFLKKDILFIAPLDQQGWYQRDSHVYLTDAVLEIYDVDGERVAEELIEPGTDYNLLKIYDILVTKVAAMSDEPMDLSATNTGLLRRIFGKSLADDKATIREIVDTKFHTDCMPLG